jgi:hypothetical protein
MCAGAHGFSPSRTPPEIRTNFRFMALAMDCRAISVLMPGAHKVQDRPEDSDPLRRAQLLDGQIFDDALLDLVEVVMIFIEHLARADRVEPVFRRLRPRTSSTSRDGADHLIFGRCGRHPLQAVDLRVATAATCPGGGFGDPSAQFCASGFAFSKLLLNGLELLAEEIGAAPR